MAYIRKFDGQVDRTINLGDKNNPTPASIEGYFMGSKTIPDSGYGEGKLHIFQTKEGTVGVWGKTNSNRLLTADLAGQMCLLTFTGMGEKKKGKNPAYNYSLQHDPLNKLDVSGVNLNAMEPESEDEETETTFEAAEEPTFTPPSAPVAAMPRPSTSEAQKKLQKMLDAAKHRSS